MERRRVQTAWPRCPWAAPGHCHSPPTGTRTTPEHDIIRPTTTTPGHFRYKTLPARPKWLNLALFLHAGRVLYRCHHQEAEQGEFCTERAAEIEQANTTHQAPPACRAPKEPEGPEGSGGSGGRRARPRCRHPVGRANTGSQGQRQKNFAHNFARSLFERSSPVEWCNRFVSFGVGYALSWSGGSSCWVGWGVSRDLVRMSRLR